MQLLKVTEPATIARWDGTALLTYIRQLSADLQAAYTFTNVSDTLSLDSGDGTSSVTFSGDIKLYIDSDTGICLSVRKRNTSDKICVAVRTMTPAGNYWECGVTNYNYTVTTYCAHAIWKTETDQIVFCFNQTETLNNCTPLSRGGLIIIGTATNQYSNISSPTILNTTGEYDSILDATFIYNAEDGYNRCNLFNRYCRGINTVTLPRLYSDIAVLYPVVSPYNHYIMDNVLVASLLPTCFSTSYSTITYHGHQYAQFGRYLLLDESEE